jgi:hypothetical protein
VQEKEAAVTDAQEKEAVAAKEKEAAAAAAAGAANEGKTQSKERALQPDLIVAVAAAVSMQRRNTGHPEKQSGSPAVHQTQTHSPSGRGQEIFSVVVQRSQV